MNRALRHLAALLPFSILLLALARPAPTGAVGAEDWPAVEAAVRARFSGDERAMLGPVDYDPAGKLDPGICAYRDPETNTVWVWLPVCEGWGLALEDILIHEFCHSLASDVDAPLVHGPHHTACVLEHQGAIWYTPGID